jgi:outer membrane protein insertion porin family
MRHIAGIIGTVFLAALLCSAAQAARQRSPGGPIVKEIGITGAMYFSEKRLKGIMRTKESRFLRTKRLRESMLESDLVSIVAFYRRHGFLRAEARIDEITYDDDKEHAWIRILVREGLQTMVGDILLEGNVHIGSALLQRVLTVKVDAPLDESKLEADKYNLYIYYADRGFVFASISHRLSHRNGQATVYYIIDEGEPADIGRVDVRGNRAVRRGIITREVSLKPGEIFSRKKLLDSQQGLYDTGLFKDVEIEPMPGTVDSSSVELLVKVKERQMREVSFGLGYGTRDETRVTVGWLHRNLGNAGRQFEVRTILASKDYDKGLTRTRGDISLTDRWLLGRRLTGGIALFLQRSLEEYGEIEGAEYTLDRVGVELSVKKDISRKTRLSLSYTHELVDVRDPTWEVPDTEELRITLDQEINRSASMFIERDTRRPFFDPQGGSLTRLVARTSGGIFGGDNSYSKFTWSWARYLSFYGASVIALSTRTGFAEAFGPSKAKGVPEYERFYAGGASTIRGYDEHEFGPGDLLLLANIEIRYPIIWRFVGVLFLDIGNTWPSLRDVKRSDFDPVVPSKEFGPRRESDVKYSTGVGLGVQTPVGPARVDYGFRLKRGYLGSGDRESPGMFHITIGHAV